MDLVCPSVSVGKGRETATISHLVRVLDKATLPTLPTPLHLPRLRFGKYDAEALRERAQRFIQVVDRWHVYPLRLPSQVTSLLPTCFGLFGFR